MACTIWELLDSVDVTGRAKVYTNSKGLKNLREGNSFYIWTKKYATAGDIALMVHEKDLAEDSTGIPYIVDGLDALIV
jgi:hypothetical protein